ncbi:MAG: VWA domain-containing protein [Vicinamibacteria bacterium]
MKSFVLIPLIPLWLGAFLHQDEPQDVLRFGVEVRTVYADVFVTYQGKPIVGLTAEDFELLDNGVPQDVELMDTDAMGLSTMLVVDTSDSVLGEKLDHLKAAAHAFVEGLAANDEVGLLTFSRGMRLRRELGSDLGALHRTLDEPMEQGRTSLHDALYTGLKLAEARAGRPLVLLFTDGLDNTSWLTDSELLEVARESEAVIHVVGVRPRFSIALRTSGRSILGMAELGASDFLQSIARETGGRVWYCDSGADLKDIYLRILAEVKSRYLLSYQPQSVSSEGWHTLEVRLKGDWGSEIRARPGYLASPID